MRPARGAESPSPDTPPYRFAWDDCYATLERAAAGDDEAAYDPYNGYNFEYVNPETGQPPVMSTMSLRLQLMRETTESHRHNSTEVYHAVTGSGRTQVGDQTIEWHERDTFVVPPGSYHSHQPADEAVLFAMSDAPIFDAFKLHREETTDDPQLL
jgi:gentisate 1,2-dioxygenase